MQALNGIRVIDLTRVLAGPYATMILADLGAEVIKVEALGGDEARGFGPFKADVSGYFQSINRGKKSVALNLKHPDGRDILLQLLDHADILVENYRPGAMARLGLDYATLQPQYPRLIYAACSGFGQTGPNAHRGAYDAIIQGMGGIVSVTGEPGRPPVRVGASIGDLAAALFTVIGILSALHVRETTGQGQMVDIGMLDCQVALLENAIARYDMTGAVPGPLGSRHPSITPFQAFETSDGWVMLAIGNDALWAKFCHAVDRPDLVNDKRFTTNVLRTDHHAQLESILSEIIKSRTTDTWISEMDALDIPCGPIQTVEQVIKDPQVLSREMILQIMHPIAGRLQLPGSPIKLSETPVCVDQPAPDLGEHTDAVLSTILKMTPDRLVKLRTDGVLL